MTDRSDCGDASASDPLEGALQVDRREVVVGLAAGLAVATSTASAQTTGSNTPNIRLIRNPDRHDEFGIGIEFTVPDEPRKMVALYPRLFGDTRKLGIRSVPLGQRRTKDGTYIDDVSNLDRFSFPEVIFSDRSSYSLTFEVDASGVIGFLSRKGKNPQQIKSSTVRFPEFLQGSGLEFELDWARAEQFRWDIFGERLEVEGKGAKLTLILAPPAKGSGYSDWTEPELQLVLEPKDDSRIWAIEGTVVVNKLRIKRVEGGDGDGAFIQEQQELKGALDGANKSIRSYHSDAWIGEAIGDPLAGVADLKWDQRKGLAQTAPLPGQRPNPLRRYRIGNAGLPRAKPAIEIIQSSQPTRLTLRQWGSARHTLAMLRGQFKVTVLSPGKTEDDTPAPAVFPLADAILTRQDLSDQPASKPGDIPGESIEETLVGRLVDKPFSIDTYYGSFIVEGDPPPSNEAGKKKPAANDKTAAGGVDGAASAEDATPKNPLGRKIERRQEFAPRPAKGLTQFQLHASRDEIRFFDVRALLRQIALTLPNTQTSTDAVVEDGRVWSRLDFGGTEIAFRLPLPEQVGSKHQTWPSARGIVTLGEPPRGLEELTAPLTVPGIEDVGKAIAPPVSIALDGACLQARRDSDNLALMFQFARMALELGKDGGRIVPNLRLSGAGAGQSRGSTEIDARKFDDRSLLIVNFPPQHVAEQAYYRQINDGVSLPDVPDSIVGDLKFAAKLKSWRELPLEHPDKLKLRQTLWTAQNDRIKTIIASKDAPQKDPLYDQVTRSGIAELFDLLDAEGGADRWQDKVGPEKSGLLQRWNNLPKDQRAYYLGISANAMDPDVRKVWSDIWRAYNTYSGLLPDVASGILGDKNFSAKLSEWASLNPGDSRRPEIRKALFDAEKIKLKDINDNASHPLHNQIARSGILVLMGLVDPDGSRKNWQDKVVPSERNDLAAQWDPLPVDQRAFYLGTSDDAMDNDARVAWRNIWRSYLKNNPGVVSSISAAPAFADALRALPDVDISQDVQDDIKLRLPASSGENDPIDGNKKKYDPAKFRDLLAREKRKRSDDFDNLCKLYSGMQDAGSVPKGLPLIYSGQDAIQQAWDNTADAAVKVAILDFVRTLAQKAADYSFEHFNLITPARLSGPSRLVFRFEAAGGSFDDKDRGDRSSLGEELERVRSIHFSYEGLTDWGRFDLAVTRRAETLEMMPGGRVPHPDMRGFDLDPARILAHQGIRPGRSIDTRMADIQKGLRAPGQDETAIELPFRLVLSPDQFGRFRTRRPIARNVLRSSLGADKPARLAIAPMLWSANLQVGDVAPTVRAIWSDDFRPGALSMGGLAPPRGPIAPWQVPPKTDEEPARFRTALDAYDRHEIVVLSSVYGLPVMGRRNELDSLVDGSQFEPPKEYKLDNLKLYAKQTSGTLADLSGIYNPAPLNVSELRLTALGGSLRHDSSFTPPAGAVRYDDKNLFEALSVERWRQTTVLGRDVEVEVVYKGFLFPLGIRASLIKLTERRFLRNDANGAITAFLIQRKFIRIGKPTKSFPATGQPDRSRRFPISDLTMLTRETPDIVDPDLSGRPAAQPLSNTNDLFLWRHPNGKVEFSPKQDNASRLDGLCFWPRTRPGDGGNIFFEFRVEGDATRLRMPMIFVDNRAANNPDVVKALATYYNWPDKPIKPDEPNNDDDLAKANRLLRTVAMGGSRRRYADENKDGECTFETYRWEIRAEGRQGTVKNAEGTLNSYYAFDPLLQGSDQPPFYPYVALANVRIGQAERFIGHTLRPTDVAFFEDYRVLGFPSADDAKSKDDPRPGEPQKYYDRYLERYLEVKDKDNKDDLEEGLKLDMGEAGDRSGGIGRPAMVVRYLSRRHGLLSKDAPKPLAAPPAPARAPTGDPSDDAPLEPPPPPFDITKLFNTEAKLLGIITFIELLEAALAAGAGSAVPELKEQIESATEETAEYLRQTVLPEIERALKSLEEMWQAAQKALTSQASTTRGVATLEINKIYPDIAPALDDLIVKVQRAEKAPNGELVAAMTAVQASGRKFVTAINRTLADPVAPLREELRSKFRLISDRIHAFGDGVADVAHEAIAKLRKDLIDTAKAEIENSLRNDIEEIKPFTRLIVALPVPAQFPVLNSDAARQQVAKQFDTALAEGTIAFVGGVFARANLSDDAIKGALQDGLKAAEAKLDPAAGDLQQQASDAITAYKAEAKSLLDRLESDADTAKQQLLRQVPGVLYPLLFGDGGVIRELSKEADGVEQDVRLGGRDVLEIVARHVGRALSNTTRILIEQQTRKLCDNLAGKVAQLALTMLPPAEGSDPPSVESTLQALDDLADAIGAPRIVRSDDVVTRYQKLRKSVTDDLVADACVADNAKSAITASVAKVLQELTALQQAIEQLVIDVLRACEQTLPTASPVSAVAPPDSRLSSAQRAGENFRAFVGNLGQAIVGPPPDVDALVANLADQLNGFIGIGADSTTAALKALAAAIPPDPTEDTAVNRAISEQLAQLRKAVQDSDDIVKTTAAMMKVVVDPKANPTKDPKIRLQKLLAVLGSAGKQEERELTKRLNASREALNAQFTNQAQIVKDGIVTTISGVEDRFMALLGEALAARDAVKQAAIATVARVARPVLRTIREQIYGRVDDLRKEGQEALAPGNNAGAAAKIVQAILKTLRGPNGQPLTGLFRIPPEADGKDQLDRDIALLERVTKEPPDLSNYVGDLVELTEGWKNGNASPLLMLRNIDYVLSAVLKGDIAQFVDLQQIRRQVDQAIRAMVPARIRRSYDLKLRLSNLGELLSFDGKSGLPRPHPKGLPGTLVLRATGVVDVLQPKNSTFDAEGYLPGFALQLLPAFDVVTFSFPPTTFTGGLGKPFHISLKIDDVKLGKQVEFLQKIQSILPAPKNGNGFFIRMLSGRGSLGIVAGYALPISPITIGNMFIDNLSLNAAAELPFDNSDARFVISISRPEAPFMIAVAPYAGAGHFGLIANPKGIVGFEASFQFGGGGGFSFGPLTGKGRISVGIYIRKISGLTELYGLFYAGGSARIACFAVGAQLNVRMSQKDGDAEGEAIFTFTFSIGIKDIEYPVTVFKREKGSGSNGSNSSDARQGKIIDLASHEFREVFAAESPVAFLTNDTRCKGEDFSVYRTYFSRRDVLAPGRDTTKATAPKPSKANTQADRRVWVMP